MKKITNIPKGNNLILIRFNKIFDSIPGNLVVIDTDGKIVKVNQSWFIVLRIYGLEQAWID